MNFAWFKTMVFEKASVKIARKSEKRDVRDGVPQAFPIFSRTLYALPNAVFAPFKM